MGSDFEETRLINGSESAEAENNSEQKPQRPFDQCESMNDFVDVLYSLEQANTTMGGLIDQADVIKKIFGYLHGDIGCGITSFTRKLGIQSAIERICKSEYGIDQDVSEYDENGKEKRLEACGKYKTLLTDMGKGDILQGL